MQPWKAGVAGSWWFELSLDCTPKGGCVTDGPHPRARKTGSVFYWNVEHTFSFHLNIFSPVTRGFTSPNRTKHEVQCSGDPSLSELVGVLGGTLSTQSTKKTLAHKKIVNISDDLPTQQRLPSPGRHPVFPSVLEEAKPLRLALEEGLLGTHGPSAIPGWVPAEV